MVCRLIALCLSRHVHSGCIYSLIEPVVKPVEVVACRYMSVHSSASVMLCKILSKVSATALTQHAHTNIQIFERTECVLLSSLYVVVCSACPCVVQPVTEARSTAMTAAIQSGKQKGVCKVCIANISCLYV
jgi:hypothetical protein